MPKSSNQLAHSLLTKLQLTITQRIIDEFVKDAQHRLGQSSNGGVITFGNKLLDDLNKRSPRNSNCVSYFKVLAHLRDRKAQLLGRERTKYHDIDELIREQTKTFKSYVYKLDMFKKYREQVGLNQARFPEPESPGLSSPATSMNWGVDQSPLLPKITETTFVQSKEVLSPK